MIHKSRFMEALLVFVSILALFSTASGNVRIQQTVTTSITTSSTTTTASAYTVVTVLSTTVSTISATFLSDVSPSYIWWTTNTLPIATVTNIAAQLSTATYPVVTVFIEVSAFTTSIASGFDSSTYLWILLLLGLLLTVIVAIVAVLVIQSPSSPRRSPYYY